MLLACKFSLLGAPRAFGELASILRGPWLHGSPEPYREWDGATGKYITVSGFGKYEFEIITGHTLVVRFDGRRNSFLGGTPEFQLEFLGWYKWSTGPDTEVWLRLRTISLRGEVILAVTSRRDIPLVE